MDENVNIRGKTDIGAFFNFIGRIERKAWSVLST